MQIKKAILLFFLNLSIFILPVAYAEAEANINKININTADAVVLEKLWGVGPKKAIAIIEFRDKNGKFESIDDLKNVKGVGQKIIDENQDKIEVALIPEEIQEVEEPEPKPSTDEEKISPNSSSDDDTKTSPTEPTKNVEEVEKTSEEKVEKTTEKEKKE
ncbi:helix-hairpin-helix domain-containing protein [Candidatus Halobeggiatoa sp. HSG11]|nr:helix-hairpin-helix domain-containing protein [Candidatus Halobeggiatoa sp. HSG11]